MIDLWTSRDTRVLHAIANGYYLAKVSIFACHRRAHSKKTLQDLKLAATFYEKLLVRSPGNADLLSALGRVYLQAGSISAAQSVFEQVAQGSTGDAKKDLNSGLLSLVSGGVLVE